jgi:hypothetical protein
MKKVAVLNFIFLSWKFFKTAPFDLSTSKNISHGYFPDALMPYDCLLHSFRPTVSKDTVSKLRPSTCKPNMAYHQISVSFFVYYKSRETRELACETERTVDHKYTYDSIDRRSLLHVSLKKRNHKAPVKIWNKELVNKRLLTTIVAIPNLPANN